MALFITSEAIIFAFDNEIVLSTGLILKSINKKSPNIKKNTKNKITFALKRGFRFIAIAPTFKQKILNKSYAQNGHFVKIGVKSFLYYLFIFGNHYTESFMAFQKIERVI